MWPFFLLSQSIKRIFPSLKSNSLLASLLHTLRRHFHFQFTENFAFLEKLTAMFISFLVSTLLLGSRLALGQEDCTVFKEGACPLEESNIIGNSGDATNAAECQVRIVFMTSFLSFVIFLIPKRPKCFFDSIVCVCGQAMCKFEPTGSCNFFTYLGSQCYLLARSSLPNIPSCIPNVPSCIPYVPSCVLHFSLEFLPIYSLSP